MNSMYHSAFRGLALLSLAAAVPAAHAQTTYYTGTGVTITAANSAPADAVIGLTSSGVGVVGSTVTLVTGGSIGHDTGVHAGSTFTVNDGTVGGTLSGYDTSTVTVNGGHVLYSVFADNSSTVNINSGKFDYQFQAFNSGIFNISGGVFPSISAFGTSTINFFGDSLTETLVNPSSGFQGAYSQYKLSGTLADGNSVNGILLNIANGSGNNVTVRFSTVSPNGFGAPVPEPGSIALLVGLGVSGAGFLIRRRRK